MINNSSSFLRYLLLSYVIILCCSERAVLTNQFFIKGKSKTNECKDEIFAPIKIICEINGFSIPAIIDTGAEISIMSSACAKRCHLSNQIDMNYSGKALGVGSGHIIGRLDDMTMRIGPLSFKSRISVLRDSPVDFLIGMDFLRRFKADISIKDNTLRLQVKGNSLRIPLLTEFTYVDENIHDESEVYNDSAENVSRQIVDTQARNNRKSTLLNSLRAGHEESACDDDSMAVYVDNVSMEGV